MFAGRYEELVALEKTLFQTKNGNATHFLIDGERGIGKSSLLLNLTWVAKGNPTLEDDLSFNFITVSISLDSAHSYSNIVRAIASEMHREIAAREQLKEVARAAWNFLKKWEVGGVRFRDEPKGDSKETELVEELAFAISESLKNLGTEVDGVLILMDEADKPPASANLGALVKLLTERLKVRNCDRVCIGLAGLTTLRARLRESHESSLRLFNVFALKPLLARTASRCSERGCGRRKTKTVSK